MSRPRIDVAKVKRFLRTGKRRYISTKRSPVPSLWRILCANEARFFREYGWSHQNRDILVPRPLDDGGLA